MAMKPPYTVDELGIDFTIRILAEPVKELVLLDDAYGYFLPIPMVEWIRIVNRGNWKKLITAFPETPPQQLYYNAVQEYCREYNHNYICLN